MGATRWRSRGTGTTLRSADEEGRSADAGDRYAVVGLCSDPARLCGAVSETVELGPGRSVRAHLRRIGFRPVRRGYREWPDWFVTKKCVARITGFGRATLFVRLRAR